MAESFSSWRLSISEIPIVFPDLTPIILGDDGVAAIDYNSDAYDTAYGTFAASLPERSERVLKLTATCLQMNQANYTVWHHRRKCWRHVHMLNTTSKTNDPATTSTETEVLEHLVAELSFTSSLGGSNPKNYQIWYHRRALLEEFIIDSSNGQLRTELWDTEIGYIDSVLTNDAKNYHAWSNRQWLVHTIASKVKDSASVASILQSELETTETMIADDVRNNSAWNHRWWCVHHQTSSTTSEEMGYVMEQVKRDQYNESSWRYLVALVKEQDNAVELAQETVTHEFDGKSRFTQAAVVDLLEIASQWEAAAAVCWDLAHTIDAVRKSYWESRHSQLQTKLLQSATA